MLPLAKKVAIAIGLEDGQYNLLQVMIKFKFDEQVLMIMCRTTDLWLIK
jgi:hypothetical protein